MGRKVSSSRQVLEPEQYFTDGIRLWEVVACTHDGAIVSLEDVTDCTNKITLARDTFNEHMELVTGG